MYKLGVDVGGTKIKIGLFSKDGDLIVSEKIFVKDISKNVFEGMADEILYFLNEKGVKTSEVEFCGIGVPGTVDPTHRVAIKLPNLGVYNLDVASVIESKTGIKTALVQDSRAAAWGEYCKGNGKGYNTVVCITIGTGIGTGFVVDGKIYDGALNTAGEMAHNIVVDGGRYCNCGKNGCMGMYSAGLGLNITAKELFGEEGTSKQLFEEAKKGNKDALDALNSAIKYLGNEVASLYNSFSPDCILFSGGICDEEEFYVKPLIEYIKTRIYTTEGGVGPYMSVAGLREDAPLYGAALQDYVSDKETKFSASMMCADVMNLAEDFKRLEDAGVQMFHMDIMDNHFVPNMMMAPEFINRMRKNTDVLFDVHIMAEKPEEIVNMLKLNPGDIVCVHYESTPHIQRVLSLIKSKGYSPALAINPGTSFESIKGLLCDIDMILVMTVNPGFAGQKLIPQCLEKTTEIREYLDNNGFGHIEIEVDGNCSFENIPVMKKAGANIFVLGTSGLFRDDISMADAVKKIYKSLGE